MRRATRTLSTHWKLFAQVIGRRSPYATVSLKHIKHLRELTGAGIVDCKTALVESNGDETLALEWLFKRAEEIVKKKSNRIASEGLITIAIDPSHSFGGIIELLSETDYVPRLPIFQDLATTVAESCRDTASYTSGEIHRLYKDQQDPFAAQFYKSRVNLIGKVGENTIIGRTARIAPVDQNRGFVSSYIHDSPGENKSCGKLGVLVAVNCADALNPETKLDLASGLGRKIAKQIATSPLRRTADFDCDAVMSGDFDAWDDKSVQTENPSVRSILAEAAKTQKFPPIADFQFLCWEAGEEIEKRKENFAEEVAKKLKNV
eukprot:TRINITY_DN6583_c0_g1_i1.p1 TRINITY_DN6583_c0_g1~~TRINITY_DN6583_c0_g1_i1.p1  ORF type:complete len:319 (-),score=61.43 TRINITY_DN6583_c0_g1_i1:478-1434(-)